MYRGTEEDYHRMLWSVYVNCSNRKKDEPPPPNCGCPVHRQLDDQHWLNRQAFIATLRERLISEEFCGMTPDEWLLTRMELVS